ncbi:methyl-accepting chemotaxis protein [Flocculibacter collagenilyticus]|uniref:methyl-accepting chemotaxis protein n=1 Tax=Flocculibacter collagenilyticus TaxID=2744479 RepID=UPI0018F4F6BA|nr:methyl-accepting chemotaxis protein [Flocculibacter collagenilyticus]
MNLTVANRIWGGFLFISLLLLFIGASSLTTLDDIAESTQQVNEKSIPALTTSSTLQVEFVKMGRVAVESYHTQEIAELDRLKKDFQQEQERFNIAADRLETVIKDLPSLRSNLQATKDTYKSFTSNVNQLTDSHRLDLELRNELISKLENLEEAADDGASLALDFTDLDDANARFPAAVSAALELETSLNSIVTIATDLVNAKAPHSVSTITKEISFATDTIVEKMDAITTNTKGKDTDGVVDDLTETMITLRQLLNGNDSIVELKNQRLTAQANAQSKLNASEKNITEAIAELNDLVDQAKDIAEKIQDQVNDDVSSGNIQNIIVMIVSVTIAAGIAYWTVHSITEPLEEVNNALAVVASGDMTHKITVTRKDEFGRLANNCNTLIESLRDLIQGIISRSTQLAAASEETSAITKESSTAIQEQRSQVEQAATATTEMSSTSVGVTHSANEALVEIKNADKEADRVKKIGETNKDTILMLSNEVDEASRVIHKLNQDSASIGGILDVIRGIAEQTNLLALNAAIEAARAGEQGRGFAVVADEVRSLASKTQDSTQEIQSMIQVLQQGAEEAVEVMAKGKQQTVTCVEQSETAAEALESITHAVHRAHDVSEQIASAAQEQSQVSGEISERLESIVAIAEQTASGAEQTEQSSHEVARLAEELRQSVDAFKV